ncbi:hypothetical protein HMPREF9134_00236 [Porphyromonas catoniae F0037]|uniref:Uncharacterized protein n=1 Tax=Porphyromonas catoniae F0037 TaxID=1127696 RepID=L1NHG1_9PORP|nr:hypothetical protein HMPREF9134_00236 [Porphyromonas catoniae F0037]
MLSYNKWSKYAHPFFLARACPKMCDACAIIAFEGASLGVICICLEILARVSATPMQGSERKS